MVVIDGQHCGSTKETLNGSAKWWAVCYVNYISIFL